MERPKDVQRLLDRYYAAHDQAAANANRVALCAALWFWLAILVLGGPHA